MGVANISGNILTDSGASLSSYLPLTGGTLTGALNGTSATFSGAMRSNGIEITNTANADILDIFQSPSVLNSFIDYPSGRSLILRNKGSQGGLTLASTGAATFSSSVTASGNLNLQGAATRNINFYDSSNTNINAQIQYDQLTSNTGQLFFGTNNAGTFATRMTITSSGNVGIGTSSPSVLLHAYNGSGTAEFRLERGGVGDVGARWKRNGSDIGYVSNADWIIAGASSTDFAVNAVNNLIFGTSATERMRITSGGVVLINKTSADAVSGAGSLQVGKEIFSLGSSAFLGFEDRNNGTYKYGWYATGNTIVYFYSSVNGNLATINPSSGTYTALSDINKKKDFEDSTIGLNAILGLKPTLYRMKDEDESIEKHLGFIAQEVKEFIPQAYVESGNEEDKFIGLTDRPIIAALVKAVQELSAKVTALENK